MAEMALATAAAATTAATAGLAYLNAKLHLRKDLDNMALQRKRERGIAAAMKAKRASLYNSLEKVAAERGDADCFWSRDRGCYSWRQMWDRVNQYAQFWLSRGVQKGDLVALYMVNSPDFPLAWIGLWAVGAAPAMINYSLAGKALLHCMGISTARLMLVDGDEAARKRIEDVRDRLEGVEIMYLEDVKAEIESMPPERPPDELREHITLNSPMSLLYTSGTTGFPKACILPMAAGFNQALLREVGGIKVDPKERFYNCMPYYHGTGGILLMGSLLYGCTACIGTRFRVSTFWDDIRDSRATWFIYVGEAVRYLLAAPPSPRDKDHSVHTIHGNGLRPDVWRRFRDRFGITTIFEVFNSTEGMFPLANTARGDFFANAVGHHGWLMRRRFQDIYVPVRIDAATGEVWRDPVTGFCQRVPYEEGGEILVRNDVRPFHGYFNDKKATEKKLLRDVFVKGDCYYSTGDALRRDSDGRWFFLDRLGDTFRWKGENVSTAEVSEVLGHYPGIVDATVYGVSLPGHDGKAGAAAIYIDPAVRDKFDHRAFLKHARTHLPKYAVPLFLRHMAAPATTHNNKQDKAPLKLQGVDPSKVAPQDTLYWIDRHGKGDTYVPFTKEGWEDMEAGRARL